MQLNSANRIVLKKKYIYIPIACIQSSDDLDQNTYIHIEGKKKKRMNK